MLKSLPLIGIALFSSISLLTPCLADDLMRSNRDIHVYTASAIPSDNVSDSAPKKNQVEVDSQEAQLITHSISANALWTPRPGLHPATPDCVRHAVASHHLSLAVVIALMRTEAGHPGSDRVNKDKYHSHDLGVMQVNDRTWLKTIADHDMNGDLASTYRALRDDGCYNVMWGTEIFSRYVDEAQGRYWLAVGYYNSHTEGIRQRYTAIVVSRFLDILKTLNQTKVITDAAARNYANQAKSFTR